VDVKKILEHNHSLRVQKEKDALMSNTPRNSLCNYFPTLPALPGLPTWLSSAVSRGDGASSEQEETIDMAEAQQVDLKRTLRHNYSELLYAIVATRGVLLQAIPSLTILSIFASTMSRTPVMVYSQRLAGNLPELIISKPFVEARVMEQELIDEQDWIRRANLTEDQNCVQNPKTKILKGVRVRVDPNVRKEIEEANDKSKERMRLIMNMPTRTVDEWIVAINGTTIYVTESRSINFCLNLYKFILTIGMLWTDPDKLIWWMASAVIVLLPYCALTALGAVAALGKALYVTDDDLEHALGCVGLTGVFKWVLKYTGSSKTVKGDVTAPDVSGSNKNERSGLELAQQRQIVEGVIGEESGAARIVAQAGLEDATRNLNEVSIDGKEDENDNLYGVYEDKDDAHQSWEGVRVKGLALSASAPAGVGFALKAQTARSAIARTPPIPRASALLAPAQPGVLQARGVPQAPTARVLQPLTGPSRQSTASLARQSERAAGPRV